MWVGVVVLFAIPTMTFGTQYLLGTFWGWLMCPHSGLSLRGGTGCPVLHWKLENLVYVWMVFVMQSC